MDPSQNYVVEFIILGACFALSAFFSCSETALLSVNKIRIRTLAEEGNKKAKTVERLINDTDSLLSTILVGNNLVNIGASSLSTVLAVDLLGSAGAGIATGIVTFIILIFGEITPKSLAAKYPETFSMAVASIIRVLVVILTPVVFLLNIITGLIVKLFGGSNSVSPTLTEEELKTYVNVSHEEGIIEEEEKDMIHNVFEFSETEIREIMTPRIHVVSIPSDATYQEFVDIYQEAKFSRLLVHNHEDNDDILGVLYVKDLVLASIDRENFNITDYVREAFVCYEFKLISDVFENMRKEHVSMAIVLDEYGVMSGIVTLEDIIEEIVGDIDDEYDEEEDTVVRINDGIYLLDGSMNIDEVNEECGTHFSSEDFESIGGLVLGACDGVPEENETLKIGSSLLTIKEIDKNRIVQLKLEVLPECKEEEKQD